MVRTYVSWTAASSNDQVMAWLGAMSSWWMLQDNGLEHHIPSYLFLFCKTKQTRFSFYDNQTVSTIPGEIRNLTLPAQIDVEDDNIFMTIPELFLHQPESQDGSSLRITPSQGSSLTMLAIRPSLPCSRPALTSLWGSSPMTFGLYTSFNWIKLQKDELQNSTPEEFKNLSDKKGPINQEQWGCFYTNPNLEEGHLQEQLHLRDPFWQHWRSIWACHIPGWLQQACREHPPQYWVHAQASRSLSWGTAICTASLLRQLRTCSKCSSIGLSTKFTLQDGQSSQSPKKFKHGDVNSRAFISWWEG